MRTCLKILTVMVTAFLAASSLPAAELTGRKVVIDPGHDGWVEGDEPAILIEFDFLGETAKRFGLPDAHRH